MLTVARVPPPLNATFELAEVLIKQLFSDMKRRPEAGSLHLAGERYVLMRAESLYLAWYDALAAAFGDATADGFVYNTAREIGRSDGAAIGDRLELSDPVARLACGPTHFAYAGWACVEIFADSAPSQDETFFLHYSHPNTFESEVLRARKVKRDRCACLFSAGYSSGWTSQAFGVEAHAREIRCLGRGDARCEFIMAPADRLDAHAARLLEG